MRLLFYIPFFFYFLSSTSSLYLRSKNTVFDDDGINFTEIKSNETTEDYTLTLPREEVEGNNSCTSISKYLYIHLLLGDDLKITDIEVNDFDVTILLD